MRCYNLVFNFKIFCHNYGSIITLIFFIIYVIFMIYYSCKTISPIKISISKLLFDEQKKEGENELNDMKKITFGTKSEKSKKGTKSVKSKKTGKIPKIILQEKVVSEKFKIQKQEIIIIVLKEKGKLAI